ncbi:hypothetical protein HK096_001196 [Nowakowskiella sp. JEL0078]|nr:hypothetical protein HK096_001196 [Nowakowskiella sp. JEL0078]
MLGERSYGKRIVRESDERKFWFDAGVICVNVRLFIGATEDAFAAEMGENGKEGKKGCAIGVGLENLAALGVEAKECAAVD